ncbi:F0F1 ATP synthase subunit delta [Candidatus Dependentiae bacterium]|nr:F0F1 ATP synthase subunit delta [Candidatus Dependentiae bacterium]
MRYTLSAISKKYAQAYLKEYQDSLTIQQVQEFKFIIQFFRNHYTFLSIVSVLAGRNPEFCSILDEFKKHFTLSTSIQKLMNVLVEHNRLAIFGQVLQDIYCLYMLNNDFLEVAITTAEPLEAEHRQKFEDFFKKLSGKKIISTAMIDEGLIAGIRMQSDLFLWEYSIKSRIAKISRKMFDEE